MLKFVATVVVLIVLLCGGGALLRIPAMTVAGSLLTIPLLIAVPFLLLALIGRGLGR